MSERRRSLFVLLIVARPDRRRRSASSRRRRPSSASTSRAASSSSTRAEPTAQQPTVDAGGACSARSTSCASASTRSASPSPSCCQSGEDQIEVNLPGVEDAERAAAAGRLDRPAVLLRLGSQHPRRELQDRPGRERQQRSRSAGSRGGLRRRRVHGVGIGKCDPLAATRRRTVTGRRRAALLRLRQGRPRSRSTTASRPTRARRRSTRLDDGASARTPRSSRSPPACSSCATRSRAPTRPTPTAGGSSRTARASRAPTSRTRSRASTRRSATSRSSPSTSRDEGRKAFQEITRRVAQRGADNALGDDPTCDLAALRDRARQRARLGAVHQLPREPGRHRRLDRRPDLRQLHDPRRRRTWRRSSRSARCR